MNYLQRLKQKIFPDIPFQGIVTLAKGVSVPFTADRVGHLYQKYGIHLDDIRKEAGTGWSDIKHDPSALQILAHSIHTQSMIDRGEVPPDYKYVAYCRGCGPVWLWFKGKVEGCPWCWNRLQGKSIPYPGGRHADRGK